MQIERDPEAPHVALLWIEGSLHQVRKDGSYTGTVTKKVERFAIAVKGSNLSETERKLNTLIDEVKQKCQ